MQQCRELVNDNDFIKDATDLVDIIHGNANLPEKLGFASGEYKKDVSPYVVGWILGIEWDPYFVQGTNEPYEQEDMVVVNMEHKDENGKINTYKAYLRDLFKEHTMPVLVAEFGVPSSRGMAHESKYSGYNQGNHDETEQGRIVASLLSDIYEEGYCGALVFTWQDEWFKRTWNTTDFDLPDQRPFWSNPQTNEQAFGLLAFEPGDKKSICYVDGDISDWQEDTLISTSDNASIYVKSDEKYVYLMVKTRDFDFSKDSLFIPVDIIEGQGNEEDKSRNVSFERPADFLIQINNENNSRILVNAYYDSFYYLYAEQLQMMEKNAEYSKNGNGIFNPMYHCLSREIYLPEDKETIPFSQYETGMLKFGDANPKHQNYNSLTDFSYQDGNIEIRIPWQLLNVMDPSTKSVMGNLYKNKSIKAEKAEGIYIGVGIVKKGMSDNETISMGYYKWSGWTMPTYHERLKPSYYILKDAFKDLE